jgi:hypothetical protein
MARLWRGGTKDREEHFMEEMVLGVRADVEVQRARPDPHFFLDFRLKEPYI